MDADARSKRAMTRALVAGGLGLGLALALASTASRSRSKRQGKRLTHDAWYSALDVDGRVGKLQDVRMEALEGGIPHSLRAEVWPVLLGVREVSSTSVEHEQGKRARRERYREFRRRCAELEAMLSKPVGKGPVKLPSDLGTFTEASKVIANDAPRTPLAYGLFARDWEAGTLPGENDEADWQAAQRKRLTRVLEAYSILDPAIGYTQGMSDLAAVFLQNISDESEAFWCFAKFMGGSYRCHFLINPNESARSSDERPEGVSDRLRMVSEIIRIVDTPMHKHWKFLNAHEGTFAVRPVLVLMSRELAERETELLWDALIAAGDFDPTVKNGEKLAGGGARLFLHIVAATLIDMRSQIMACKKFDELLKMIARKLPARNFAAHDLVQKGRQLMRLTRGIGEAREVGSGGSPATLTLRDLR